MTDPEATYRDLPGVMSAVDVDRPEWAEQYAVGDEIAFRNPESAEVERAPVAGFSSLDAHHGLPVIVVPEHLRHLFDKTVGTVVIPETYHVPPNVAERAEEGNR